MSITNTACKEAKPTTKPFKLTDSHGLYLEVKPNGSKLWRYRYKIGGKENVYAIGEYPHVGLANARLERDAAKKLVKKGIHPAHDRKLQLSEQITENDNTFKAVATEWIEGAQKKKGWSDYYAKQVKHVMETDIFPLVGSLPIRSLSSSQMLGVLERIEKRGANTVALLARQWCSAVFRYAIGRRKADNDPMFVLRGTIERPPVKSHKPIPLKEIPAFLRKVEEFGGHRTTYVAIKLLMLTFVRTGELRAATWDEFDLENNEWRIPAHRMKMREEHVVPLAVQVVELLKELKPLTGGQQWLFPNFRRPAACMSATTINRALEYMGYAGQFSAHGFRSTASTQLNEMGYKPDVIERQLAHSERGVRARYNRAEYMEDRRKMMQQWADYLDGLKAGAKVMPINRKAA